MFLTCSLCLPTSGVWVVTPCRIFVLLELSSRPLCMVGRYTELHHQLLLLTCAQFPSPISTNFWRFESHSLTFYNFPMKQFQTCLKVELRVNCHAIDFFPPVCFLFWSGEILFNGSVSLISWLSQAAVYKMIKLYFSSGCFFSFILLNFMYKIIWFQINI